MIKDIRTPCHNAILLPEYETVGPAYLTYERVSGYECSAYRCYNSWDADGNAGEYNKYEGDEGFIKSE